MGNVDSSGASGTPKHPGSAHHRVLAWLASSIRRAQARHPHQTKEGLAVRKHSLAVVFLGVALLAASSDAWALGVRVKRGGNKNTRNKNSKDGLNEEEQRNRELHNQHIMQIPGSLTVAAPDTAQIEKHFGELSLTDDQARRIEALKVRLRGEVDRLNRAQVEARKLFIEGLERDCSRLANELVRSMQACKEFNADSKLKEGLAEILRPDQWKRISPESSRQ